MRHRRDGYEDTARAVPFRVLRDRCSGQPWRSLRRIAQAMVQALARAFSNILTFGVRASMPELRRFGRRIDQAYDISRPLRYEGPLLSGLTIRIGVKHRPTVATRTARDHDLRLRCWHGH